MITGPTTENPIEKIIEYVMKTPENINANILREMLEELIDQASIVQPVE